MIRIRPRPFRRLAAAALAVCLAGSAFAQHGGDPVEDAFRLALLRLSQDGLLDPGTTARVIERPAEKVANFGALVDREEADGLRVLGTLPGGSAERIGLRSGDVLLAANGTELRGAGAGERMRDLLAGMDDGAPVRFDLLRDGRRQQLAGTMQVLELPAVRVELMGETTAAGDPDSVCARLSTFPVPSRSRQLHPARLLAVEGGLPGPSSQDTFRVAPGRYRLTLAEDIDSREFSAIANRQRSRGGQRQAVLELEVQAGITYLLAARLLPERRERILEGGYWQPVVWRQRNEPCR
ncbi:MAG: PDZ domain-containing protein [Xanthomonadales bacterium]|nr:PDZ domain-containing protein [Xanthomonadales bacterium]